jgi:hypothetical protein
MYELRKARKGEESRIFELARTVLAEYMPDHMSDRCDVAMLKML